MLLKKSQKLHSNKYGRYFGNSILSYIFKNITETIPSRVCAVVSLKPGRLDWVRDYVFRVKPVYPFPPLQPYYLYLRRVLHQPLWSYLLNHPLGTVELVSAVQPQLDFGYYICSRF